jgi:uncharacterized membrane protein YphA (DoxX/SURF4 family)
MSDTTATPADFASFDLPAWKKAIGAVCALLLALLFFVSGAWKLTDPFLWSQALVEFRVTSALSLPGTLALGVGEMVGAVLILVPRFRRWGAWLIGFLLVVFMVYIGANYGALVGKDCSCFPLVKRAVGPAFFFEDGAMLVMAAVSGIWARRSDTLRGALVILGA